jgi:hypothetical protein
MQDQLFIGIRAELKAVVPHKEVVPRVLGVLDGGRQGRGGNEEREASELVKY